MSLGSPSNTPVGMENYVSVLEILPDIKKYEVFIIKNLPTDNITCIDTIHTLFKKEHINEKQRSCWLVCMY